MQSPPTDPRVPPHSATESTSSESPPTTPKRRAPSAGTLANQASLKAASNLPDLSPTPSRKAKSALPSEDSHAGEVSTASDSAADSSIAPDSFLAAVLEQSYRHLFGPTSQPAAPRQQQVVSMAGLTEKLDYLKPADLKLVKAAFQFSDESHLGQYRQSGEPYITHPMAVAEICVEWKLDADSIIAALLHDVMEDQGITRNELVERFSPKVAELVDGLTKLDKLEFQNKAEAQAESFRKMLLAMARDVRVILVKLADRLHNMRTLGHVPPAKRRRIATETMDIYAPIAHRLGLNNTYRELQDLSFKNASPFRYATLEKAIKAARGNRREVISKILEGAKKALQDAQIEAEMSGREKTVFSIYRKMRAKRLSFSQVLDVFGFRVVVQDKLQCYMAMGALHSQYKPMPGKFKDYIAIPKLNGYQSLHTTLVGPFGTPVEFQIRSRDMHEIAEEGVAAHWMYKNGLAELKEAQQHAHQWLQSLLDIQSQTGDSQEFLEHVKIDLFPDAVYVFTPKGEIRALPRGATALDFAYAVHSDLGDQCVAIKLNNELLPLRTELKNGDIVEIITAPHSRPNPSWLSFVRTGKARAAIRHTLKNTRLSESVQLGERMLEQAVRADGIAYQKLPKHIWEKLLHWTGLRTREELFADIALGRRVAAVLAKRLEWLIQESDEITPQSLMLDKTALLGDASHAVTIHGNEGMSVQYPSCCYPIPGDTITGYLGKGEGLQLHTTDCAIAARLRHKHAERWIEVVWAAETLHAFDVAIEVMTKNGKGVLARVAADITAADANIVHLTMDEDQSEVATILNLVIQVQNRQHLAQVMRSIRRNPNVIRLHRVRHDGNGRH